MLSSWNKRKTPKKTVRAVPLRKGAGKARWAAMPKGAAESKAKSSKASKRDPNALKAFMEAKRREKTFRGIERAKQREQRDQDTADANGDMLAE